MILFYIYMLPLPCFFLGYKLFRLPLGQEVILLQRQQYLGQLPPRTTTHYNNYPYAKYHQDNYLLGHLPIG